MAVYHWYSLVLAYWRDRIWKHVNTGSLANRDGCRIFSIYSDDPLPLVPAPTPAIQYAMPWYKIALPGLCSPKHGELMDTRWQEHFFKTESRWTRPEISPFLGWAASVKNPCHSSEIPLSTSPSFSTQAKHSSHWKATLSDYFCCLDIV